MESVLQILIRIKFCLHSIFSDQDEDGRDLYIDVADQPVHVLRIRLQEIQYRNVLSPALTPKLKNYKVTMSFFSVADPNFFIPDPGSKRIRIRIKDFK
jgi:hypothetical protein